MIQVRGIGDRIIGGKITEGGMISGQGKLLGGRGDGLKLGKSSPGVSGSGHCVGKGLHNVGICHGPKVLRDIQKIIQDITVRKSESMVGTGARSVSEVDRVETAGPGDPSGQFVARDLQSVPTIGGIGNVRFLGDR